MIPLWNVHIDDNGSADAIRFSLSDEGLCRDLVEQVDPCTSGGYVIWVEASTQGVAIHEAQQVLKRYLETDDA